MIKTTELPLIHVNAEVYTVDDVDNAKLAVEMLSNTERLSNDATRSIFEDRAIQYNGGSEFEKLLTHIRILGLERNLELSNYRLLIHEPLEATNTHHHFGYAGIELSWVYYVQIPKDSGKLVFLYDQYDLGPNYTHQPVEGTLLLFPPYLLHKVTKNMSSEKRISIAGDFSGRNWG